MIPPHDGALKGDHHGEEDLCGLRLPPDTREHHQGEDRRQGGRGLLRGVRDQAARSQREAEETRLTPGPGRGLRARAIPYCKSTTWRLAAKTGESLVLRRGSPGGGCRGAAIHATLAPHPTTSRPESHARCARVDKMSTGDEVKLISYLPAAVT